MIKEGHKSTRFMYSTLRCTETNVGTRSNIYNGVFLKKIAPKSCYYFRKKALLKIHLGGMCSELPTKDTRTVSNEINPFLLLTSVTLKVNINLGKKCYKPQAYDNFL